MADEQSNTGQQAQEKENLIPGVKHVIAVSSGKDGSFSSCGNVDRVVNAAFGACVGEGVDQLFRSDSGDRNDEICYTDKGRS